MHKFLGVAAAALLLTACGSAGGGSEHDTARVQPTLQFRKVSATPDSFVPPSSTGTPTGKSTNGPSSSSVPRPRPVPFGSPLADPTPPADWAARMTAFACPTGEVEEPDPDDYALVCDEDGNRYLLEPATWAGAVEDATAEIPEKRVSWVVNIDLDDRATRIFAEMSTEMAGTGKQFAVVLDGHIIAAPTFESPITNGQAQIVGNFTEKGAQEFADRLAGR